MSESKEINIDRLKINESNPRFIRDDRFEQLKKSIREFPNGMKFNRIKYDSSDAMKILAGNMRHKALNALGYKKIPNEWIVDVAELTKEEKERLIIIDNINFGAWDYDFLNEWDEEDLEEWGMIIDFGEKLKRLAIGEEIEIEQSVQIEPPREYILIMADPNSVEWEELKQLLKLRMLRRGGYKKNSMFDHVGLERVIEWSEFKKRYADSDTKRKANEFTIQLTI